MSNRLKIHLKYERQANTSADYVVGGITENELKKYTMQPCQQAFTDFVSVPANKDNNYHRNRMAKRRRRVDVCRTISSQCYAVLCEYPKMATKRRY
jgi:hypothetical protein